MRTYLACVLALSLGAATTAVAQNGVATGASVQSGSSYGPSTVGAPGGTSYPPSTAPATSSPYAPANIVEPGVPLDPGAAAPSYDGEPAYPIPPYARPARAWLNAEYLLWWARDQNSPALVQTVPDNLINTVPLPAGSTSTLFPTKNQINYLPFSGVRLTGGFWLDSEAKFGLDASGFALQQRNSSAAFASNGSPVLAQSYFSANSGVPTVLPFANPDPTAGYSGAISVNSTISSIWGVDGNFRCIGYAVFADSTDWLFGGRYFNFNERLDTNAQANFKDGSKLMVGDHFATKNQFYGAQAGVDSKLCGYRGFSIQGIAKLAIGDVHQTAEVNGFNTLVSPAGAVSRQLGGLYAQPSNIGTYSANKIGVLPEFTLNLAYNFTNNCSAYVGYNILWLNNVTRPGGDINTTINDANVRYITNGTPGSSPQPQFKFSEESFWVQGITFGLRLQF